MVLVAGDTLWCNVMRPKNSKIVTTYLLSSHVDGFMNLNCKNIFPRLNDYNTILPDEQFVVFNDHEDIQTLLNHRDLKDTKFTKWFDVNKGNAEPCELIYVEFSSKWVWNREKKEWTYRKQRPYIGRLTYAHPNSGEHYFL